MVIFFNSRLFEQSLYPALVAKVYFQFMPILVYLTDLIVAYKYRLKRKEKNKSREEIFYQMKVVVFC